MCARYVVSGRVQGVFFRASARQEALRLGLRGWVRNLPDGRVESIACGELEQINAFEKWLEQGPPMATVSAVEKFPAQNIEDETFDIL
ncbi:MAG: acylphosphatase [Pseudomonadota bacterium]